MVQSKDLTLEQKEKHLSEIISEICRNLMDFDEKIMKFNKN